MDSSHVSLCAMVMRSEGFDHYRCDMNISLGVNTGNLSKILKCAGNEDVITLKSEEQTDNLTMHFESPSQDRVSEFELKLMDIESEHLGIPDTEYKCNVRLPASEFQRIIRDLGVLGDSCEIVILYQYFIVIMIKIFLNRFHQCNQRGYQVFIIRRPWYR
jgi:proliferating cell nuclear antigen